MVAAEVWTVSGGQHQCQSSLSQFLSLPQTNESCNQLQFSNNQTGTWSTWSGGSTCLHGLHVYMDYMVYMVYMVYMDYIDTWTTFLKVAAGSLRLVFIVCRL